MVANKVEQRRKHANGGNKSARREKSLTKAIEHSENTAVPSTTHQNRL